MWLYNKIFNPASCDAPLLDYSATRADPIKLRTVFYKYASVEVDGYRYITPTDLIRDLLHMDAACFNETTLRLLSGVVDLSKDGLISYDEFQAFEALLCNVDAKYKVAFQMFDLDGKGFITFKEFEKIISSQTTAQKYPFNFECEFVKRHFGADKSHAINYHEFTQLIHQWNKEYVRQLFEKKAGSKHSVSALEFVEIMKVGASHRLNPYIVQNMMATVAATSGTRQVSYVYCMAFYEMLENFGVLKQVLAEASGGNKFRQLTKGEILQTSMDYPQVSPLQVEILFDILTVPTPGKGKITEIEAMELIPTINPLTVFSKIHEFKHYEKPDIMEDDLGGSQSIFLKAAESSYRFALGSIAGACGAAAVFPIDLVKTRMQNQRSVIAGELQYRNSFDCFKKVLQNEGFLGFYRGLIPQLIGVSPEKAIKLTTNDLLRDKFTDKDGEIRLAGEILAGGCGGGAQVMFTNPIEIVKIRMQVAGEAGQRPGALMLCRELGFRGLYKGAQACLCRDVPFSAIYFPCYAHFKKNSADKNGYNTPFSLLISAGAAGIPAAYLVTPADVVKTRLQVKARRGQQTYSGLVDCARKIYHEEGATAFFKGGPARIFRSSPQFAVTLVVYEMLQRYLYVDFGGGVVKTDITPVNPEVSLHPDHIGGLRLAVASFSGVESKFGLMFPKFNTTNIKPREIKVAISPPPAPPPAPATVSST